MVVQLHRETFRYAEKILLMYSFIFLYVACCPSHSKIMMLSQQPEGMPMDIVHDFLGACTTKPSKDLLLLERKQLQILHPWHQAQANWTNRLHTGPIGELGEFN